MASATNKIRFMAQLNASFGSGDMGITLNDQLFISFIQYLKHVARPLPIRKAAATVGLQPCGKVWVLGPDLHVSSQMLPTLYTLGLFYLANCMYMYVAFTYT